VEQHDQAGGTFHTFIDKGYEFDVGVHYIGDVGGSTLTKTLWDQLADGQMEFARMDEEYDVCSIGLGDENRKYPVISGESDYKALLKKQFPEEEGAIEGFFDLLREVNEGSMYGILLKILPLWVSWLLAKTGVIGLFCKSYSAKFAKQSTLQHVRNLTSNKDLQTVFTYCFGNMGVTPDKSGFPMQAAISNHYLKMGGYYPVGGASEFTLNLIPVIERAGGKVLVRATVEEILFEGGAAVGVRVRKGSTDIVDDIRAKCVISDTGILNTFNKLIPPHIGDGSFFRELAKDLKPSCGSICVFVGFNASNEELGLRAQNTWAYVNNDGAGDLIDGYMNTEGKEAVMSKEPPLLFLSFPSTKDPNWKNHPGRENKSTAALITMSNYEWYKEYAGTSLHKRGDDYEEFKAALGDALVEFACKLYPKIRHHIDYVEVATPMTNNYYLGQLNGELYGLEHDMARFDAWTQARLRPKTDVPGLFMTGQDILSCGVTGAAYAGVLTASAVLERNVIKDLMAIKGKIKSKNKKAL